MPRTGKNLKTKLAASAFLTVFFISTIVPAEMKLFPMWERMQCGETEFACYNFDTAQKILKLDIDMQSKLGRLETCTKNIIDLTLANIKLNNANTLLHGNIDRLNVRLKEKDEVLTTNTNQMVLANSRDVFGGALPWVIGALLLVAAAAFTGGYYTGSR